MGFLRSFTFENAFLAPAGSEMLVEKYFVIPYVLKMY